LHAFFISSHGGEDYLRPAISPVKRAEWVSNSEFIAQFSVN
jgi:hypothetical protein